MILPNLHAIIIANQAYNCLKNGKSILSEKLCGQKLVLFPMLLLEQLGLPITLMLDNKDDLIPAILAHKKNINFIENNSDLKKPSTIDTIASAHWYHEHLLIMTGNMPLISPDIITQLYQQHCSTKATVSFMAAHHYTLSAPYEQVIKKGKKIQVIPNPDRAGITDAGCYVNAGIYIINKEFFTACSTRVTALYEYINEAYAQNLLVNMHLVPFDSIRKINSYQELWAAEHIKRSELINYWMDQGVQFTAAHNVYLDIDITIGAGTVIGSGVHLLNGTTIGTHCTINSFSILDAATIADNVTIDVHSVIRNARIEQLSHIGPFAHVHSQTSIGSETIIGNFVEIKQSIIGDKTKAKHLNYLGNAHIGNHVNIGAGTITCNHNGVTKEQTTIKDNAYIGSNNSLIAPVTIENNAFTAAGSVITDDVPENALAIARTRQINKEGYAEKLRTKKNKSVFAGAQKINSSESTS